MAEIHTYPEMNAQIKDLLRIGEQPICLYAAKRIDELEEYERKKGEWINIESKLPPEDEECLIYDGDAIYVWELRRDRQTNELLFEDKYGYYQDIEEVEYWMPLPEPPKEET